MENSPITVIDAFTNNDDIVTSSNVIEERIRLVCYQSRV
jgi:hypothetical protein